MKKILFGVVIGVILCTVTFVTATILIASSQVSYNTANSHSSYSTVQGALDDLYIRSAEIIDSTGSGFILISHPQESGLSSELVAGLYRYQGTTADNYICFGTTDKNTCVSDTDKYMYRIIGINSSGQMKLIKKEALNDPYAVHNSNVPNSVLDWPDSDLYNGLNGSYFLTNSNYVPDSSWSNRIALTGWHYGVTNNINYDAATMANIEEGFPTTSGKINILSVTDYNYGLVGGNNCNTSGSQCKNSWLYLWQAQNDSNPPSCINGNGTIAEWTSIKYGTNSWAGWAFSSGGEVRIVDYGCGSGCFRYYLVRPVFYLTSNQIIASGIGTLSDPYILS